MAREIIQTGKGDRGWEPVIRDGSVAHLGREGGWEASRYELNVDAREGDGAWLALCGEEATDFEFRARMMAQEGTGNASIFFRQHDGGQRYYQFDLHCRWRAVVVSKADPDAAPAFRTISAVNWDLVPGLDYDVELAVRGESITTYVGGKLANQVRDGAYPRGTICLTAWKSRTRFFEPRLRFY